ncbi:MAG: cation transporter [Bacteroidia bacterium]|nr:cation transporter [Bacteroidia bacterium]NNF83033.1 heavy-metal-associated domain-containing protein [Flavobacteriaceae bacterium]NNK70786.1 heavy-metal-associated domain-containing protein [Flavobacteriaceae bacterium]
MKTLKNLLVLLIVTTVVFSCKNEAEPEVKTVAVETAEKVKELDPNATYAKAEFTIEGMTCAMGCAKMIEGNLNKMEGVKTAVVDFERELAMVEFDEAKVNHSSLEETVNNSGESYAVKEIKTVDSFQAKKECDPNCKKECCQDKTEAEKKECAKDCKKACCASKA